MKCINHRQARLFIYGWGVRNGERLAMRLVCISSLPRTPGTILYHSHVDQGSSTEWLSSNVWQKLLKASITATSRPKTNFSPLLLYLTTFYLSGRKCSHFEITKSFPCLLEGSFTNHLIKTVAERKRLLRCFVFRNSVGELTFSRFIFKMNSENLASYELTLRICFTNNSMFFFSCLIFPIPTN